MNTSPPRVVALGGTTRPDSSTERALRHALDAVAATGAQVVLLAGDDLVLPMYAPHEPGRTPAALRLVAELRRADGVIIASPGYHGSLSGLGSFRRAFAILLRSAVVTLIILALAEMQAVRRSERLTTIFLVDVSQSVPRDQQKAALDYATEASKKRRKDDLVGVIVFGKGPRVEVPPAPSELNLMGVESTVDAENTDLASAMKLALATFPEDTARRIVILSDGNENRGNLLEQTLVAKSLGVQVDVLPIDYFYDREVLVEKVSLPPDVKKGETVNINVVIRASEPTTGTLQIFQKADGYLATVKSGTVTYENGEATGEYPGVLLRGGR